MRQHLVKLVPAFLVGGCSLIYNPSNIKAVADGPEMIIDANPAALTLTSVAPATLMEGQGAGGSRQAVLVITGDNIVPGATITIAAKNGTDTPMVATAGSEVVAADHKFIAVPVTAGVNVSCDANTIPLTITVSQSGATQTIDWSLTCLPQIDQSSDLALSTAAENTFSQIHLTGSAKITASDTTGPLIVRAMADIAVAGDIDVSASGATAGPGGKAGGIAAAGGSGDGGGGPGGGLLGGGGGGAGYHDKGADGTAGAGGAAQGDPPLTMGYGANYASGGGGGDAVGGGGGGTVELTAGGSLTAANVTSKGAAGGNGGLGKGGGGGAGGTIVLRGTQITLGGALSVAQGAAGSGGGGAGSPGRIRVDGSMVTGNAGAAYLGVAIDSTAPAITNMDHPTLTVHGGAGDRYDVFTLDASDNVKDEDDNKLLVGTSAQIMPQVHWGYNKICVVPRGGAPSTPESTNCIAIAFIP
jgi:hypothetical protein